MPSHQEYPPLLTAGFHSMSLDQVKALCVTPFEQTSTTRSLIMFGLVSMIGRLEYAMVQGEIWIDGSFVTEKIDPIDVDILLHVKADFYNNANTDQQEAVDWVASNLKTTHRVTAMFGLKKIELVKTRQKMNGGGRTGYVSLDLVEMLLT